jgi:diguanylate cyclase (GGDEF)-like protein
MNQATSAFPVGESPSQGVSGLLEQARALHLSQPEEALDIIQQALREATLSQGAEARLLAATITYLQGNLERALPLVAEALQHYVTLSDKRGELESSVLQGRIYRDLGQLEPAAEAFEKTLVLARHLGDQGTEGDALNLLASVCSVQGDYPQALEYLEAALALVRALNLSEREANILNNIGTLQTVLGDYPKALESLTLAYELLQKLVSESRSRLTNFISLGSLYHDMGNLSDARIFFSKARETSVTMQDALVEAVALNNLANLDVKDKQWSAAQGRFQEALAIAQRMGAKQYEIDNLDGLGQVYVALEDFKRAADTHRTVLEVARDIGDREGELDALLNLGKDFLVIGQPEEALTYLQQGLGLAEKLNRQPSLVESYELLSQVHQQRGNFEAALHAFQQYHKAEKTIFNEENEKRTRRLTVQFDLERSRHEAEEYRLRTELLRQARDEAEAMVRERTRELEEAQLEIVTRLAVAAEYRDDDTGEHTKRVGRNAAAIAHALGWKQDEVQLLFTAARLHDVGKIGISDTILHKPGKLESEEMAKMRTHTTIGARILSAGNSELLKLAEEISLAHHERWDGKGYPLGLKGETIPLSARIVAVADVLDALTHERPYKRAWSVSEALAEIERQAGHQFDPRVVEACGQVFGRDGGLSPTTSAETWTKTLATMHGLTKFPSIPLRKTDQDVSTLKERFERLLAERTKELETTRREAQLASQQLQELAHTDALTGLPNRRAFESDLETEVARSLHHGDTMSVLTLDLDMLKHLNDTSGHERGDALLQTFASVICQQLKNLGRVYRVGGDEFMAILSHTGVDDFENVTRQIRTVMLEVRRLGFPGASVSVGLAALSEVAAPGDLVRLSDQRMYQDKLWKRNNLTTRHSQPHEIIKTN